MDTKNYKQISPIEIDVNYALKNDSQAGKRVGQCMEIQPLNEDVCGVEFGKDKCSNGVIL